MLLRRVARPMLASIFITGGLDAVRNPAGKAQVASSFLDKSINSLPKAVTNTVPTDTETLVRVNGGVQLVGGVLLAVGKFPRIASLALAGSLVPTTLAGHSYWEETDPAKRGQQRIQFYKNLTMLGGLLISVADTEAKPSLAWRGRRAAKEASLALAEVLPSHESTNGAVEFSKELADSATAKSKAWAHTVADRAPEYKSRASAIAEAASERAAVLADVARARSEELANYLSDESSDLSKRARKRSEKAAKQASKAADQARSRAEAITARVNKQFA